MDKGAIGEMSATITPEIRHRLALHGRILGQFTMDELWQLSTAIDTVIHRAHTREDWQDILSTVCRVSGFSWDEMVSKSRTAELAYARQIAMALIYERTTMSLAQVGEKFGGRDHGTVLWANETVRARRGTSQGKLINTVEAALKQASLAAAEAAAISPPEHA
jgi:chromosomal replication initiator protein